ncbi:MAG: hypothetical protein LUD47_05860 [Clostridia bacterium]|nr:hypothetical protein [Clostridia bacterium]
MRKLAHIEKIVWKRPIEGADRIELVGVLGWQCIAKKDEFQVGDLCVYIEIDSVVDKENPDFAFLENRKYKIKTLKMRGTISQGIVFPLEILHGKEYGIGDDLTSVLRIREIEDEVPKVKRPDALTTFKKNHPRLMANKTFAKFMTYKWFRRIFIHKKTPTLLPFPDWIVKTDEYRLQEAPEILEQWAGVPLVVTEKVDGTSSTYALRRRGRKTEYIVCSRNKRLTPPGKGEPVDAYHEIGTKYGMEGVLKSIMKEKNVSTVVLQGEILGPDIQGNKYSLKEHEIFCFNLILDGVKLDSEAGRDVVSKYGLKWVPILDTNFVLLPTVDEMIAAADGTSKLRDTLREGLVIRSHDTKLSFKCISNEFLLKHNL